MLMLNTLSKLLDQQYEASLGMLNLCVAWCPDGSWKETVANWKFCQAAFHTVFFTDLHLQSTDDIREFKLQRFHLQHAHVFRDYEELVPRPQVLEYEKTFVLSYLRDIRRKARETVAGETSDVLAGQAPFNGSNFSRAALHVYNIRHIQHHAAQLSMRLRLDTDVDIPWLSHEWRDEGAQKETLLPPIS